MEPGALLLKRRAAWTACRQPAPAAHHQALVFLLAVTLAAQLSWPVAPAPSGRALPRVVPIQRAAPIPAEPPLLPREGLAGGAPSPTGRQPKLLWSPRQQAVWNKMREDHDPWFEYLKSSADRAGTANPRYGDYGQWATVMYQVTGDPTYAEKAWHQITHGLNGDSFLGGKYVPTRSSNFTREYFIDYVWMYDWLRPWLTPDKRKLWIDTLNYWADAVTAKKPAILADNGEEAVWVPRLADSDNTTGHYFGLAMLDLATAEDNPRAGEFLKEPIVGGLVATSEVEDTTMRNAVGYYCKKAEGGTWVESTEYNIETLRLLFMGAEAVKGVTHRDYFPEITKLEREVSRSVVQDLTPDLLHCYEWGDVQGIRTIYAQRRVTLMGLLSGVLQNEPDYGPYVHQALEELKPKHPQEATSPWPWFFIWYNPYAPAKDWRTVLPKASYASGQGLMLFHNGWGEGDSLFGAHFPRRSEVDHEVRLLGDFQLYRHGEWAITHPIAYGLPYAEFANCMVIGGLSAMFDVKEPVAQEFGPNEEYAYLTGTTRGNYYDIRYYADPPPIFIREWSRSVFYLPSKDRSSETVIVHDRVDADDPKKLPKVERYYQYDKELIDKAEGFKQWILHTASEPAPALDGYAWSTPKGQNVRLATLLPPRPKVVVHDEKSFWPEGYPYPAKTERHWQIRITPATDQAWDTFLNVVQVSDSTTGFRSRLVRSPAGEVEGALASRPGQDDALVLFGAKAKDRRLDGPGYTITWSSTAPATDLYLCDMHPERSYAYSLDGRGARQAEPSEPAGLVRIHASGPGEHSLKLVRSAFGG